nr:hypothetical protein [uncultured Draconibacterium sp.]
MKKVLIFSCLLMTFIACNKDEDELPNVFQYQNDTSYPVKIVVYGESIALVGNHATDTINIAPFDISEISYNCVGDFCKGSDNEPFRGLADSAKIVFDNNRQLLFRPGQNCNSNILCRKAYVETREGDNRILQYIIDQNLHEQSQ